MRKRLQTFKTHAIGEAEWEKERERERERERWESAKVSHKRVFALLTPETHSYEIAPQMLPKPVFALPRCQRMSVNTLLCDTLGLAEERERARES